MYAAVYIVTGSLPHRFSNPKSSAASAGVDCAGLNASTIAPHLCDNVAARHNLLQHRRITLQNAAPPDELLDRERAAIRHHKQRRLVECQHRLGEL
jgi:hypothetical protein